MITEFLKRAGMSVKEQEIYLAVLKHGAISCNAAADQLARERTSTYKLMMSMTSNGFLSHSKKQKTVLFSATPLDTIKQLVQLKHEELQKITDNMSIIEQEFQNIQWTQHMHTNISIHEGKLWLHAIYWTILSVIEQNSYIHIKHLGSKTFQSLSNTHQSIQSEHERFINELTKREIVVYSHFAEGMELAESLSFKKWILWSDLASSNNAVSTRIIDHHIFIIIFKREPEIIHITNKEYANFLNFICDSLQKVYEKGM